MSKKKRLSEDAFSWIQDTTEKAEKPKPAKKPRARSGKTQAATESTAKRFIFIEYDKNDGHIVATHEILREADELTSKPWTNISEDKAAVRIALTEELSEKELIDIHHNYKIVISNKKPTLVPKD
jgi:hypothetical protein